MNAIVAHPCDWEKHFLLMNDLDLAGMAYTPIGTLRTPFTGTFDGNGHTIANLTINIPPTGYDD